MASAGGKDFKEGENMITSKAAEKKPENLRSHCIFFILILFQIWGKLMKIKGLGFFGKI